MPWFGGHEMSGISGVSSDPALFDSAGTYAAPYLAAPSAQALVFGKGEKAARDFEAQLIGSVLQSLEKTFASLPGKGAIAGEDDYNYLGVQALASGIAAQGGFGIARMISASFERAKAMGAAASQPAADGGLESTKVSVSHTDGTR
jgi:hypothetical protein